MLKFYAKFEQTFPKVEQLQIFLSPTVVYETRAPMDAIFDIDEFVEGNRIINS